jgi:peptidoglycan hydrolase-like protein with peptidoglycan-binding domain
MSFRRILFFYLFLALLIPTAGEAQYTRTLRLGVSGDDVRALQRILNQNTATQITSVGPGSPGQETGFFGVKTRDAVMRFQELYRSDILVPAGVSAPTGIAGPMTLAKAASLTGISDPVGSASPQSTPAVPVPALPPLVLAPTSPLSFAKAPVSAFGLGKSTVTPGEIFVLYGSGFDNEKIAFSAGGTLLEVHSRRSESVGLVVPQGMKEGAYEIVMIDTRSGALIENGGRRLPLSVTNERKEPPTISSIEPAAVSSAGGEITIRGTGFAGDVYVLTPFGPLKARVIRENEIAVNLADAPYYQQVVPPTFAAVPAVAMPRWNVPLMVATGVGISEQSQVTITR